MTDEQGEPWFVGKDICDALGYTNYRGTITRHVDEDDVRKQYVIDKVGREQETTLINESGLYSLIMSSKLPGAKAFKHWVVDEVLPTIRKHIIPFIHSRTPGLRMGG